MTPYLYYEDTGTAMEWLAKAFGFRERLCMKDDDGTIRHAEMELGKAVIMMGSPPDYKNPRHAGMTHAGMYVFVDDVDAHYARAKAAGAELQGEPADQSYGDRNYGALDPEGQQWWFSTPVASRQ
jgi:uncharacterized glyoxalase superfamily protein PhnB